MLAQSFKSATDLRITEPEQRALIQVLGMLERGELRHVEEQTECDDGFNIGTQGQGCGTPACIGGWAARLMGKKDEREYVNSRMVRSRRMPVSGERPESGLSTLYWGYIGDPDTSQAAIALRSYLTTGDARWDLAVAP
jgi:hypothetical protein